MNIPNIDPKALADVDPNALADATKPCVNLTATLDNPQLVDMNDQFEKVNTNTWINTSNNITESICVLLNIMNLTLRILVKLN